MNSSGTLITTFFLFYLLLPTKMERGRENLRHFKLANAIEIEKQANERELMKDHFDDYQRQQS